LFIVDWKQQRRERKKIVKNEIDRVERTYQWLIVACLERLILTRLIEPLPAAARMLTVTQRSVVEVAATSETTADVKERISTSTADDDSTVTEEEPGRHRRRCRGYIRHGSSGSQSIEQWWRHVVISTVRD
jgi:hypothetical protein